MGIMYLGKFYLVMTVFCFASMTNGVNLTDGLDGLAGGCAALAFIGMSVAVLAICPGKYDNWQFNVKDVCGTYPKFAYFTFGEQM